MKENKKGEIIETRKWGSFRVVEDFDRDARHIRIKNLIINQGCNISYQFHNERSETWYLLTGEGEVILDGVRQKVKAGDVITIPVKQKHTIRADEPIEFVEVQYGTEKIREEDIERLAITWEDIIKLIEK